ncbi:MAG: HEAT repeat domain-containing protein [Myxococcota bacterium]|nr:HEAT repeat domain-containing protein [Myxococcota bacterium]
MHRTTLLSVSLAGQLAAGVPTAFAQTSAVAPAGGGLPALDVKIDLASATVDANGTKVPIAIERSRLPQERDVLAEVVALGMGKQVVHVRVPVRDDFAGVAWEALLAGGRTKPLFAGLTGPTTGDPGERTGNVLQLIADGTSRFVVLGDTREDLRICGQSATLLHPTALYPAALEFRTATVQRLTTEQRANAQTLRATASRSDSAHPIAPPLARLLDARGSSVSGSIGAELTDGDPRTHWFERRPGAGQGEFVVLAAPKGVRITRMRFVVPPLAAAHFAGWAAPQSFYLVTNAQTFQLVLPSEGSLRPGGSYEVTFPQPLETSCVSLVLDGTAARLVAGEIDNPDVGLAEVVAYSEFDISGATLDDVARRLPSDRGDAAAQVLERAGKAGLTAVEKAYEGLDARGRARAVDVAAARDRCDEGAPLLSRSLCEREGEAPRKAREKLARCREAAPVLIARLREDRSTRACVATTLSSVAPDQSLDPIADALADLGESDHEGRAGLRVALAVALRSASTERLAALVEDTRRPAPARLELLRAAGGRLPEIAGQANAVLTELLTGAPSMRTRYLVMGPVGELARAGDQVALNRLVEAMTHDPEWPVRARAAVMAAGLGPARGALVSASGDSEPRVREAALESLAGMDAPAAVEAAMSALLGVDARVRWTFVALPAVAVLAAAAHSTKADAALAAALGDRSTQVRVAVLSALGARRASSFRDRIRERLADKGEDAEVRAAAARALGLLCDAASVDGLTVLARSLGTAGEAEDDQQVAIEALGALAAIQPRDLRDRVAPLLVSSAPPYVRAATQQALAARGSCR